MAKHTNLKFGVAMLLTALIITSALFIYTNISSYNNQPSKTNYLGLAQLGLIPSTIQCSHNSNMYNPTGIFAIDGEGNKYTILQSKFGDESCLARI